MDTQKTLGQIIKEKRLNAGYSQSDVAMLMPFAFNQPAIARIEKAKRNLTLEEAVYLAKILDCPLGELTAPFAESEDWYPDKEYAEKLAIKREIAKLQQKLRNKGGK